MDKIKIFISWSGPRSAAVAAVLKEYLPLINNNFLPWLSSDDIPTGSRSTDEIADALKNARAGIICLTPNNLTAPWILYEAGGIAKTVEKPLVCPLLIGLEPSQVSKPLGDFQGIRLKEKEPLPENAGLLRLVRTLNKALGDSALPEATQERTFNVYWSELKEKLDLNRLPSEGVPVKAARTSEDMLAEVLDTLRSTAYQDSALLNQAVAGIATILTRLPDLGYSIGGSQYFGGGLGGGVKLSSLLGAGISGADASTTGNETPIVPPASPTKKP
jgi:hypothetical protein